MAKRHKPKQAQQTQSMAPATAAAQPPRQRSNFKLWLGAGTLIAGALWVILWQFLLSADTSSARNETPVIIPTVGSTAVPTPTTPIVGAVDYCRKVPPFRTTLGFSERSVLSTAERGVKGAVMLEVDANGQVVRRYQDPTWDDAGYLGHVLFDQQGDVYTFPAPYVSLIDNPPELQNRIYRIDGATGVMTTFLTLTAAAPPSADNPFGVMGLAYDCRTNSLYASSLAGSTRSEEMGKIVRIDLASKQVAFEYQGVDAFGVGLYGTATGTRLYYGAARAPEIHSIGLDAQGNLTGEVRQELTLPDANLKARRIIFDRAGAMQVRARPFDFNLIATSERPETVYTFVYDTAVGAWRQQQ